MSRAKCRKCGKPTVLLDATFDFCNGACPEPKPTPPEVRRCPHGNVLTVYCGSCDDDGWHAATAQNAANQPPERYLAEAEAYTAKTVKELEAKLAEAERQRDAWRSEAQGAERLARDAEKRADVQTELREDAEARVRELELAIRSVHADKGVIR